MNRAKSSSLSLFSTTWRAARKTVFMVAVFSAILNLLALTGSVYMLQIYDRVLSSRSVSTLIAISLLCLALFLLQAFLDIVRTRILGALAVTLERDLLLPIHDIVLRLPLAGKTAAEVAQPVRDMEALRGFLSGPGPGAMFDTPWVFIYLAFVFSLSPWLGLLTVAGMVVLIALAVMSEVYTKEPTARMAIATSERFQTIEMSRQNLESIRAMSLYSAVRDRYLVSSRTLFDCNQRLIGISSLLSGLSKSFRMILQSAILGFGAYLVLQNQLSAGAIIACSIIAGRALMPIEQLIGSWRSLISARLAARRLQEVTRYLPSNELEMDHAAPSRSLKVQNLSIGAPGSPQPIVRNVSLSLEAGQVLALIGPSGAGKSTLVRGLVGAWMPLAGAVRLDEVPLEHYRRSLIGGALGYLPQAADLFDGTVAENIGRLDPTATDTEIIDAAKAAGVHDLIVNLPAGYRTLIGEGQFIPSSGQKQRICLARALFRNPFLVVMDEPNAHLDTEGEKALAQAVLNIKARKGIAVIVSHRQSIIDVVTDIASMENGSITQIATRQSQGGTGSSPDFKSNASTASAARRSPQQPFGIAARTAFPSQQTRPSMEQPSGDDA